MTRLRRGLVNVGAAVLLTLPGSAMAAPGLTLTWSTFLSPAPGASLDGMWARTASDVWAVGLRSGGRCQYQTLTQHWDGSSWTEVPSPDRPGINNALAAASGSGQNDVWAVGDTGCPTVQTGRTLIMRWNGSRWALVTSPNPGFFPTLRAVTAPTATDAWAAGDQVVSNADVPLIEHWDGTAWRVSRVPASVTGSLAGVAAGSATDVWAVGSRPFAGLDGPLALHWNGVSWSPVPVPSPGRGNGYLSSVVGLPNGGALAVGAWRPDGSSSQALVEQWTGHAWRIVPIPAIPGFAGLSALATAPRQGAWAVGFSVDQVASHPVLLHGGAASWSLVNPPPTGPPQGVAAAGDGEVWTDYFRVLAHGVPSWVTAERVRTPGPSGW